MKIGITALKQAALFTITLGLLAYTVAAMALGGALANMWSAQDRRLFAADDQRQVMAAAAQCGLHARLLADPRTGEFACIYRNNDGTAMVRPILDPPIEIVRH